MTSTYSAILRGVDAAIASVTVDKNRRGLPDTDQMRESKIRASVALKSLGVTWSSDTAVRVEPASIVKNTTSLDLAIAVAVLVDLGQLPNTVADTVFYGELGLNGDIRPVRGVISVAQLARYHNMPLVVANSVYTEALYRDDMVGRIKSFHNLAEMVKTLTEPPQRPLPRASDISLSAVRGQILGKRAAEIAATGRHNVLFIGPPGCGKTLLARAITGLHQPLTFEQQLETAKIHSVSSLLRSAVSQVHPPFRAPHYTASVRAIIGHGEFLGEVSIAHNGVLFIDEAPEFRKEVLEHIAAVNLNKRTHTGKYEFKADFQLILAMNGCPCGYRGAPRMKCACTLAQVKAYRNRLPKSLLSVVDMVVELQSVPKNSVTTPDNEDERRNRINVARSRLEEGTFSTTDEAEMMLTRASNLLLHELYEEQLLEEKSKILRVAKTIAALAGTTKVTPEHLAEALSFRTMP